MIDEAKIMQYADGTLPIEEHEEVKKAIRLLAFQGYRSWKKHLVNSNQTA